MKKALVGAIALVMAAFGSMAFAGPLGARVNIPFAFHAGDTILPAGEYEIAPRQMSTLMLRRMDGYDSAFVSSIPTGKHQIPDYSVAFNKYGNEYFLAGMNAGDLQVKMPTSSAERKLAGKEVKGTVIAYLVR